MRTATIHTEHEAPETVADAVVPDNTPEMVTRVGSGAIVTTIERETTSGLQSTVDDYAVNLAVAETVAATARAFEDFPRDSETTRSDTARTDSETTDTNTRTNTTNQ